MDAATITTSTFTLKQGTTPISGTVAYSGTTATFTPSSNLAYSTNYTATITTGVKDAAGNAMTTNYVWSFTTGAAPAPLSGSQDASFGTGGVVKMEVSAWPGIDQIKAMAIQSDGKIVAVGRAGSNSTIVRFNSNGSLDTSFDADGIVIASNGGYYSIAIQSDGKIVATGPLTSKSAFIITRFGINGMPDSTFIDSGQGGFEPVPGEGEVTLSPDSFYWSESFAVVIQPSDGKILVGGYVCGGVNGVNPDFAIVRIVP